MEKFSVSRFVSKEFLAAEAFKTLRTNLMFSGADVKAVALTSFSATEGKSSISFQLAASLAKAGKRVLLMEADLRRSVLAGRLRIRGKVKGLSHFLSGLAKANELINETDVPGLYIMLAGAKVPNAAELLSHEGFGLLVDALKKSFDYIIVDGAPVGQVIDSAIMAPALDGMLLVIDATNNSYKQTRRMKAQLEKSGARILGVVLNRVELTRKNGYYKSYGYGYGYSEEEVRKANQEE